MNLNYCFTGFEPIRDNELTYESLLFIFLKRILKILSKNKYNYLLNK